MTFDLGRSIINHPDLKEDVELLLLHEGEVIFRTTDKHLVGRCAEYEKQIWFSCDLKTGETKRIGDDEYSSTRYSEVGPRVFGKFGVTYEANASNVYVTKVVASLIKSNVSGDDIRRGLEAYGVDMKTLYPTNYKLEKNFLGGWRVKTPTEGYTVADFLVRLYETTTA